MILIAKKSYLHWYFPIKPEIPISDWIIQLCNRFWCLHGRFPFVIPVMHCEYITLTLDRNNFWRRILKVWIFWIGHKSFGPSSAYNLTLLSNDIQIVEDGPNFCELLRLSELYFDAAMFSLQISLVFILYN